MFCRSSLLIRTVSFLLLVAAVTAVGVRSAVATVSGENGKIAFVSDRDGNAEIYVMESDGSNQVNITNNPAADRDPAWSPDGRQIVFVSDRDGDFAIFVMNSDGSNVGGLGPGTDPDWSPDGTSIAFAREQDIYVMNKDGSGLTQSRTPAAILTRPLVVPTTRVLPGRRMGHGLHSCVVFGRLPGPPQLGSM